MEYNGYAPIWMQPGERIGSASNNRSINTYAGTVSGVTSIHTRDAGNLNYPIHADCSPAFIRNDDRSKEARSQDNTNFPSPHRSPCGTAISIVCLPYRPCAFDACRARLLARLSFPEWISITLMGDSRV